MNRCKHVVTTIISTRGYTGSVAQHPYTCQNPRARGGATHLVQCQDCGATRRMNTNGRHVEYSPWSNATTVVVDDVVAFSAQPRPYSLLCRVDAAGNITVWDCIAGHYTSCHILSAADQRKVRAQVVALQWQATGESGRES